MLGDLVTSTARETGHPDYMSGRIDGGYIFFSIVQSYSREGKQNQKEMINVGWSSVEAGHDLIKIAN